MPPHTYDVIIKYTVVSESKNDVREQAYAFLRPIEQADILAELVIVRRT